MASNLGINPTLANLLRQPNFNQPAIGTRNIAVQTNQPYYSTTKGVNSYVPSAQKVLGAVTQQAGGFSGGSVGSVQQSSPQPQQQQSQPSYDPYASLRNDIGSAWDQYINGLNDVGNTYLPQQRSSQEGIINSQYDQGVNTVNTQKARSLRDIATNVKSAFQAGNNYLGALGAGDSSAANQYSFAISQDANKQTGQLNEFVNGQLSNLESQKFQQLQGVATWFAQAQAQIKQQIAQGSLSKAQDINALSRSILDQAISASNQVKANSQNQYNALLQWAANNSKTVGQLQQNIAGIPQTMDQIQVDSTGNARIPTGYGYANTEKKDIFGNPIT